MKHPYWYWNASPRSYNIDQTNPATRFYMVSRKRGVLYVRVFAKNAIVHKKYLELGRLGRHYLHRLTLCHFKTKISSRWGSLWSLCEPEVLNVQLDKHSLLSKMLLTYILHCVIFIPCNPDEKVRHKILFKNLFKMRIQVPRVWYIYVINNDVKTGVIWKRRQKATFWMVCCQNVTPRQIWKWSGEGEGGRNLTAPMWYKIQSSCPLSTTTYVIVPTSTILYFIKWNK